MPAPVLVDDGPARIAQAICGRALECECRDIDLATCVIDREDSVAQWWGEAMTAELQYDDACTSAIVGLYQGYGCEPGSGSSCTDVDCKPFHGDVDEGGSCTKVFGAWADDCRQGLLCDNDGICRAEAKTLPTAGLGDPCFDEATFDLLAICDGRLQCDLFGTNTCFDPPDIGEPCESGACVSGAWCDGDDDDGPICKAVRGGGEPCLDSFECSSHACVQGTCAPEESGLCPFARVF